MTKLIAMAGPAYWFAAEPVSTNRPPPIVTPTPKTTRSREPRFFFNRRSGSSVSAMDCSTDLVRSRLTTSLLMQAENSSALPPHGTGKTSVHVDERRAMVEGGHVLHDPPRDRLGGESTLLEQSGAL